MKWRKKDLHITHKYSPFTRGNFFYSPAMRVVYTNDISIATDMHSLQQATEVRKVHVDPLTIPCPCFVSLFPSCPASQVVVFMLPPPGHKACWERPGTESWWFGAKWGTWYHRGATPMRDATKSREGEDWVQWKMQEDVSGILVSTHKTATLHFNSIPVSFPELFLMNSLRMLVTWITTPYISESRIYLSVSSFNSVTLD